MGRPHRLSNDDLARMLREMALFLEMEDVPFKPQAYERAAWAVEAEHRPLPEVWAEGGVKALQAIEGIGKGIAERLGELLEHGRMPDLEEARGRYPVDIVELTRVEGVGPKKVKVLYEALGIRTVDDLAAAARDGRIRGLPRFGARSEARLLSGIELYESTRGRLPLGDVLDLVESILARLREVRGVQRAEVAGSVRRRRETIGDVDFLVSARKPAAVMQAFVDLPEVSLVHAHGPTKTSVRLARGIDADLRVVPRESFGAALQYFTGSKAHNVALRRIAVRRELKLNEYGLFEGEHALAGETEEGVYEALGLAWIPPELREDTGELDAAREGRLPHLLEPGQLRGDLQMHTVWSDGSTGIEEMARAAQALMLSYVAITDHGPDLPMIQGLDAARLAEQRDELRRVQARVPGVRLLAGLELDIRADGTFSLPDDVLAGLDVVGAAVHSHFDQPRAEMTRRLVRAMESPHVDILFHPTARALGRRRPVDLDVDAVIAAALRTGTVLEIDASPGRLDLPDELVRRAVEAGVPLVIDSDAHAPAELRWAETFGVHVARRGWARAADVLNTLPVDAFLARLKGGGRARQAGPRARRGRPHPAP